MIDTFRGRYHFLSNFYMTDGISVEHLFQAAKTNDEEERLWVLGSKTPGEAKRRGRKVTLRDDWEDVKLDVMYALLKKKFSDPELAQKLLATGTEMLIEGNVWHDNFWGHCSCYRCRDKDKKNYLGAMLMMVRDSLM